MRIYYECIEILPEEATEEADFVRIDITDKTDEEKKEILQSIKEQFEGKKYRLSIHYCYHDEGKDCDIRDIEVVE